MKRAVKRAAHRKGKGSRFPYLEQAADGNVSEPGDVGIGPGKSSLFFLTVGRALESNHSEIGPFVLAKHRTSRGVRRADDGP